MTTEYNSSPVKTRELHDHHFDSTIWNDFVFRNDDNYHLCQVLHDLDAADCRAACFQWRSEFAGREDVALAGTACAGQGVKLSTLPAQTHRRIIKTHLPLDALVYSPEAKYIYIARDGRDVVWSMYNHHANANQLWYDLLNDTPGRVGPPIAPPPADIRDYWRDWMDRDGHPFWPFWENVRTWWQYRHLPNCLFVHFNNLKHDAPDEMRRIARFLDIPIDESRWDAIVEYCSFDWMKKNAAQSVPLGGAYWDGGAEVFIHKGVNGRWKDVLSVEESAEYEARAVRELGRECAHWLATGQSL
ncbi:sulfotransferase domain-containing protein [Methylomicrobium sp. Wu6]|uniref:sulfotransferase domain-containing protein n=1 Tax=Methylomicrobium sp. Wu6 TaxID=3107928 RepID=UPI002DD64006|nr:sulfotransferase domain-containing protein [Methylomicrobium sp. Wu6]